MPLRTPGLVVAMGCGLADVSASITGSRLGRSRLQRSPDRSDCACSSRVRRSRGRGRIRHRSDRGPRRRRCSGTWPGWPAPCAHCVRIRPSGARSGDRRRAQRWSCRARCAERGLGSPSTAGSATRCVRSPGACAVGPPRQFVTMADAPRTQLAEVTSRPGTTRRIQGPVAPDLTRQAGSVNQKRVDPPPDSAPTRPPALSTSCLTMASPMPAPPRSGSRDFSTR